MIMYLSGMVIKLINKGLNILTAMNPPKTQDMIVQKNVAINNINTNINISSISNALNNSDLMDLDPLLNLELHRNNSVSERTNYLQTSSDNSVNNFKEKEPMNLDLNSFLKGNPDETIHEISQSNDLPILHEINQQHSMLKGSIEKRFNSLKMVCKWWSDSNISSALNALNLMKDLAVMNDFYNYAFKREDINKIPFTLDQALCMLPNMIKLINSKYENFCVNGCKSTLILLRIMFEKIALIKSSLNSNQYDGNKEEQWKKCGQLIELFDTLFKSSQLVKYSKRGSVNELSRVANSLYTDLEFVLKPYKKY